MVADAAPNSREKYRVQDDICAEWDSLTVVSQCTVDTGTQVVLGYGQSACCDHGNELLRHAVGLYGRNEPDDVRTVQSLLNECPPEWGGPVPKLAVDGIAGPKTREGVGGFQRKQLSTKFDPDKRVDPAGWTIERLNAIAATKTKRRPNRKFEVKGVPLVVQKSDMVCWAAMHAMLLSHKDRKLYMAREAAIAIDRNVGGSHYCELYDRNDGPRISEWLRFTEDATYKIFMNRSFTVDFWFNLLAQGKPLGIVANSGIFHHARVVAGIRGDGTPYGTELMMFDPRGKTYWEVFQSYYDAWSNIAGNEWIDPTAQIVRFP